MNRVFIVAAVVLALFATRAVGRGPLPVSIHTPAAQPPDDAVARGRLVYARYGCAMCHGEAGKGGVANPNAETAGKIPSLVRVGEGYTTDELRQLILRGTPTIGKANRNGGRPPYRMPGWRDRMTDPEARDLVQYLFSLLPKTSEEKWH
jgi:mono/diheme cytochrome c family protein